jgi:indole-3-glycerol phosphate synthase
MLKKIMAQKEQEISQLKYVAINRMPKDFKSVLTKKGLSFITEVKRRSPSKGHMADIKDPLQLVAQYVEAGAEAISVLTDQEFFGGSLEDCEQVAADLADSPVCVLRKDFIIDERQIVQSINAGADAVLLIVAVLQDKTKQLLDYANECGVAAIVEVHTEAELQLALQAGAVIIGINNRDLDTFETDIENCLQLIKQIPDSVATIAESALQTADDISRVKAAGFDAVLIGEALVKADDPGKKLQALKAVQ